MLRNRSTSAFLWSGLSQGARLTNQFVSNIVLARLLGPEDFGLIAMATVFTGFAALFVEMGLGSALVQMQSPSATHKSTVFWAQLAIGAILCAIGFGVAPLLAWFYERAELTRITQWMSLSFVLASVGVVHSRLLQRALRIKAVALAELCADLVATLLAIYSAWRGWGPYALVLRVLVQHALQSCLLWAASEWRPTFHFRSAMLRELMGFGSSFTLTLALNYATRKLGDVLVGKHLGAHELGLYNRAFVFLLMPLTQVATVFMRVLFPVLSRMQDDLPRLRTTYVRGAAAISLVVYPVCLGMIAVADDLVLVLMGRAWLDMVPTLQWFCVAGLVMSIDGTALHLFLVRGNSASVLRFRVITSAATIVAFLVGIPWGSEGVAAAFAARCVILSYWTFDVPASSIALPTRTILRALAGPFLSATCMSATVYAFTLALTHTDPTWRLVTSVVLGAAFYGLLLHTLRIAAYRDVVSLLKDWKAARSTPASPSEK